MHLQNMFETDDLTVADAIIADFEDLLGVTMTLGRGAHFRHAVVLEYHTNAVLRDVTHQMRIYARGFERGEAARRRETRPPGESALLFTSARSLRQSEGAAAD